MSWKRKKIKTFLRAATIKQLSFGGKYKVEMWDMLLSSILVGPEMSRQRFA